MSGQNSKNSSRRTSSDDFDPYHKWLGIPQDAQPANHYQLVGVQLFESDPEVIQNLSDQRMAHLKVLSTGQRASLAQRLLNEVMAATRVLLSSRLRQEYDAQLRKGDKSEDDKPGGTATDEDDFDHDLFNRLVNEDLDDDDVLDDDILEDDDELEDDDILDDDELEDDELDDDDAEIIDDDADPLDSGDGFR